MGDKTVTDPDYIDARQYPTILDCSTAIDDAVAVDVVERVMRAIAASRPRPFDPLELLVFRRALDREFGLTDKEKT